MPLDPRKRQKALMRQASKRKERQIALRRQEHLEREFQSGARSLLRTAADSWPLHEVLISGEWTDTRQLAQILVARRSPAGDIAAAVFLVDLGCLGVKNALAQLFHSRTEYDANLRSRVYEEQPAVPMDLNDAARILVEAIRYARE